MKVAIALVVVCGVLSLSAQADAKIAHPHARLGYSPTDTAIDRDLNLSDDPECVPSDTARLWFSTAETVLLGKVIRVDVTNRQSNFYLAVEEGRFWITAEKVLKGKRPQQDVSQTYRWSRADDSTGGGDIPELGQNYVGFGDPGRPISLLPTDWFCSNALAIEQPRPADP